MPHLVLVVQKPLTFVILWLCSKRINIIGTYWMAGEKMEE